MKICVGVTEKRLGIVVLDVPKDSPILDPNASVLKKRKAAHQLATKAVNEDESCISWPTPDESFPNPELIVDMGYWILNEAATKGNEGDDCS